MLGLGYSNAPSRTLAHVRVDGAALIASISSGEIATDEIGAASSR
jgi:hypothetical protein